MALMHSSISKRASFSILSVGLLGPLVCLDGDMKSQDSSPASVSTSFVFAKSGSCPRQAVPVSS